MKKSKIEWTDSTWNPVAGCSIISEGCMNCYAMQMAGRLEAMKIDKYKGLTRKRRGHTEWNNKIREDYQSLSTPHKWKKPRKIFVNSMSDLFHKDVSDSFIQRVWDVMRNTPQHHYQILTKRPERMQHILENIIKDVLPNVWLGTSIENMLVADRVNYLRTTPAVVRFISFEPLIGSVGKINLTDIHWAIVGGESGARARPMKEKWVLNIKNQCEEQGVAFFFKQWGTWGRDGVKRNKKANGRMLNEQIYNQMPV